MLSPKYIQDLRTKRGLTQESMSEALGVSRPTYVQIEQGGRELTIPEAQKLAHVFGVPFELFIQGKETSVVIKIEKGKKTSPGNNDEIRISIPQNKVDKFKQVLLYVLKKVGGKPNVGMTVLYKLLYFIDFDYYERFEEQLMGLKYLKNQYGPTPLLFENLMKKMVKDGQVEEIKSKFYKYPQTKYLISPDVDPDMSSLNGREMEHIDWELQRLSDLTANELSILSHQDVPWISADTGRVIDYESVFYRTKETSVRPYGNDEED